MRNRRDCLTMVGAGLIAVLLAIGHPGHALAADKTKPEQKPKSSSQAKTPKSKADKKPTFQSAEKAGQSNACFGEAPTIEKLSPDEGKAGDKITISGKRFGSRDCFRGVSFGPGNPAAFTVNNDTTITATVPKGGRKGLAIVTVTTASGEDSKPFLIK